MGGKGSGSKCGATHPHKGATGTHSYPSNRAKPNAGSKTNTGSPKPVGKGGTSGKKSPACGG